MESSSNTLKGGSDKHKKEKPKESKNRDEKTRDKEDRNREREYERKLNSIAICLQEKVEEEIELSKQLDLALSANKELEATSKARIAALKEQAVRQEKALREKEIVARELTSQLQKLSIQLKDSQELSSPNSGLFSKRKPAEKKLEQDILKESELQKAKENAAKFEEEKHKFELQISNYRIRIGQLEEECKAQNESIECYEDKIVKLEKKSEESLKMEELRRLQAEANAKRFKRKIQELDFLIKELENSDEDSESESVSDESDSGDESDEESESHSNNVTKEETKEKE